MKNTILIIVLQTVLVAAVMGGSWYFFASGNTGAADGGEASEGGAVAEVDTRAKAYTTLQPAFLVNLQDGRAVRFLQVEVDLMAYDAEVFERVTTSNSRIRNDLIMLFSSLDREIISSVEGRSNLQQQALNAVNAVLLEESGKAGVEALYFTKFVMQ